MLTLFLVMSTAANANSEGFSKKIVEIHNRERSDVGSQPLSWDASLARSAAEYARELARTEHFDHDLDNETEGENLWMGSRSYFTLEDMIGMWAEEKKILPRLRSWHDDVHAVGHYTQMVWKDTTRVGCAIASSRRFDYLVCRYGPQGNYLGESPYVSGEMTAP